MSVDFSLLHQFSENQNSKIFESRFNELFLLSKEHCQRLNFPTLKNDVALWAEWISGLIKPKKIVEFGSGFGLSAFRFWLGSQDSLEHLVLTERREDLYELYLKLPWPERFKNCVTFYSGDAWDVLNQHTDGDLYLLDGEKADYIKWLHEFSTQIKINTVIMIDNSFWKGSFLSLDLNGKTQKSALAINQLHEYLKNQNHYQVCFLPFSDGVTMLRKLS